MYGVVADRGSAPIAHNSCLPTSLAEIMACLTAPESPEMASIASLEKLVPFAGLE
jgi:hypothetical protein